MRSRRGNTASWRTVSSTRSWSNACRVGRKLQTRTDFAELGRSLDDVNSPAVLCQGARHRQTTTSPANDKDRQMHRHTFPPSSYRSDTLECLSMSQSTRLIWWAIHPTRRSARQHRTTTEGISVEAVFGGRLEKEPPDGAAALRPAVASVHSPRSKPPRPVTLLCYEGFGPTAAAARLLRFLPDREVVASGKQVNRLVQACAI
jgi:hypothetical protein